ncbi:MAG: DUF4055 domain-containing protein [Deltaproteobacteria bacterium]|nr:DUF4055 domain-containing protein [Deltaproteobacteria bacterium]
MPVDTKHQDYAKKAKAWQVMRDTIAGQDEVMERGTDYLPMLGGQEKESYLKYLKRANYYNATGRTIDGLRGMVFRKDPIIEVPEALEKLLENVDGNGTPVATFMENLVGEILSLNRVGVLVDFPETPSVRLTQAQAEAAGRQPFLAMYRAEGIVNWRTKAVGNRNVLSMVVLEEIRSTPSSKDKFANVSSTQYRELFINDEGNYEQNVWIMNKKGTYEVTEKIIPKMNGKALLEIPFIFFGADSTGMRIDPPLLKDLADVNLGHFRNSADHEHGLHFAGIPTPVLIGYRPNEGDEPIQLGGDTLLIIADAGGDAKYLEFTGQGLDTIKTEMSAKEERMAALGARMLSSEKAGVESGDALTIKRTGETSMLAAVSNNTSLSMETVLKIFAMWAGYPSEDIGVKLNTDFVAINMDANSITAWLKTWQSGGISHGDFVRIIKEGEAIPAERTVEDIQADIANEEPALGLIVDKEV